MQSLFLVLEWPKIPHIPLFFGKQEEQSAQVDDVPHGKVPYEGQKYVVKYLSKEVRNENAGKDDFHDLVDCDFSGFEFLLFGADFIFADWGVLKEA